MNQASQNKTPHKIAVLCGAASAILTAALLFTGTIKAMLLVIGLITSIAVGLLVFLTLRRVEPDFQSDTLELLFQLSKNEKVDRAQKQISKALYKASVSYTHLTLPTKA